MRHFIILLCVFGLLLTASAQISQAQDKKIEDSLTLSQSKPTVENSIELEDLPPPTQHKHPKLASALVALDEAYRQHGLAAVAEFNQLDPYLLDNDRVLVEIRYDAAHKATVSGSLVSHGGAVRHDIADTFLEAWVPIRELRRLIDSPNVYLVRPARLAQPAEGFVLAGSSTTQGVSLMNADDWHALGLTGEGVTIAIIDSFNGATVSALQSSGDWPPNSQLTLVDVDGGGFGNVANNHGMATLEIAYDLAPDANFIAYETVTIGDWYAALGLADSAGVDITSASLSAPLDGIGDGTALSGSIAEAAGAARTGGVLPVNSAGNYRLQHWGGLFVAASGATHNWGLGGNINPFGPSGTGSYYCFPPGSSLFSTLHWNDWTTVNQDYDLFLFRRNSDGTWTNVASSTASQNGSVGQMPEEAISYTVPSVTTSPGCASTYKSYGLLVNRFSGTTNNNLQVFNYASQLQISVDSRSLGFPADSANVYSMAAIGRTTGTQESYSSEGPILALGGGIPGSTTHAKPDATSYAGVDTVSYGPSGFAGTSSAAPHAAGAAVLLKQCDPTLTPDGLDAALDALAAANDLGASGHDFDNGFGNVVLNTWTTVDRSDTAAYGEATHIRPDCPNATTQPGIFLGSSVNVDSGVLADGGDDSSDDGVVLVNPNDWVEGTNGGTIDVTISGDGSDYLWAWADFNCDGDFTDSGEEIISSVELTTATSMLSFNIPTGTFSGGYGASACTNVDDVNARFRLADSMAGIASASSPTGSSVGGEVEDYGWDWTTLPVTLAYTNAKRNGDTTTFTWQTATEAGTVGFNLYGVQPDGSLQQLNDRLVLATGIATVRPQEYALTVTGWNGDTFYIEDVDIRAETDRHGPFTIGKVEGRQVELSTIDWSAISDEHTALAGERDAAALNAVRQTFTPNLAPSAAGGIDLLVDQDGIYRVTYQDFVDFGINPSGVPINRIALTNQGQAVPIRVIGGPVVGPDTFIEFVGQAIDSLHTHTNIYTITINPALAERVARDTAPVPTGEPAPFYLETVTVENDNTYLFLTPTDDPWADKLLMAYGSSFTHDVVVPIDHMISDAAPATLLVEVWGLTDWPVADDHRLQVELNGTLLADIVYDGLTTQPVTVELPSGLLVEGDNIVSLTVPLPVDPAIRWDMQYLDAVSITYPKAFVARDGGLTFTAASDVFEVSGFVGEAGGIYRLAEDGTPTRIERVEITPDGNGSFSVRFRGSEAMATYWLATTDAMPVTTLAPQRPVTDITSGSADYVMISHPSFIDGLAPLVQYHQANGLTVKVVDVDDVYAQFSSGIFDPSAIQAYVAHAVENMGTQFVLLVGGDTYDYFDNLGLGSISFIPSLYGPTEPYVSFAPLDPLFADVDRDQVPDVPIGRLPVRTNAELANIIAKTLAYADNVSGQSLLLAADAGYGADSDRLITDLPDGWNVTTAYLDTEDVATARQTIVDTVIGGVRLTSYLGHSGPNTWTFDGLFHASDAANLTNSAPTVVTQWGCWNTYHVEPLYNTLAHAFMLNDDGGAAAVLGASTLTLATSDRLLGPEVLSRAVASGVPLGTAVQEAKDAVAQPGLADVILGWTLLGDPAMMLAP